MSQWFVLRGRSDGGFDNLGTREAPGPSEAVQAMAWQVVLKQGVQGASGPYYAIPENAFQRVDIHASGEVRDVTEAAA